MARILIAGVTGVIGRALARQLVAAGHAVSGIATHPNEHLDPAVDFVCAPLAGAVLQELADDADVVVHLAPVEAAAPGGAGLDGVVRIVHYAARAGARLLFVSPAAGLPERYRQAEELVSSGWSPSLIVRIAPPVGRQLDWMVCRTVASLLRAPLSSQTVRLLHLDDLVRFLVQAAITDRTGVVDLATADTVDLTTVRRLLRPAARLPRGYRIRGWTRLTPHLDLAALEDDWNFECGWSAIDAVTDTATGLTGRRLTASGAIELRGRLPMPLESVPRSEPVDGAALSCPAPEGLEGEFDDRIDPRFPVFSATSLAAALPGPLTPMTLDVQLTGLRTASRAMAQVMTLTPVVEGEWADRGVAVFGHRPYVGVSTSAVVAAQLPGWNEHDLIKQALGDRSEDLPGPGRPQPGAGLTTAKAAVLRRMLALSGHLKASTEAYRVAAAAAHLDATALDSLSDAQLEVRIQLLRNRIHQGWSLVGLWAIDNGVTAAALQRIGKPGPDTAAGLGMLTESGYVATELAPLAEALGDDPRLRKLAGAGDLTGIRVLSPRLAEGVDDATARLAHRGTGEAELANPMFGDEPALLLTTLVALPPATPAAAPGSVTLAGRMAANARASRETAHDTTMRFTHLLRSALREIGSRRADAELIDIAADVYYLTCDEVLTMPTDARLRIKRRRAERDRLAAVTPPDVFDSAWLPAST